MKHLASFAIALALTFPVHAASAERLGQAEFYWLMDRACAAGDEISVEMLLKAGADPSGPRSYELFHKKYSKGFEPSWHLIQAAYGGHAGVVRLLLAAGAEVNLVEGEGVTALTVAASRGHLEVVRLLLASGADPSHRTPEGTADELAGRNGHPEIADLIRSQASTLKR